MDASALKTENLRKRGIGLLDDWDVAFATLDFLFGHLLFLV